MKLYYMDRLLKQLNSTNKTNYGPQSASRRHVGYVGTRRSLGGKNMSFGGKIGIFLHPMGVSDMHIFILLYLYYIYGYKKVQLT